MNGGHVTRLLILPLNPPTSRTIPAATILTPEQLRAVTVEGRKKA